MYNLYTDTKFKQQKLDAWQPILTPGWVIGTFLVVGCVFVPVGAYLFQLSQDLFESVVLYDSFDTSQIQASTSCQIGALNQGYALVENGTKNYKDCEITIEITQDIETGDSIYVYYQIDKFYQNHRRYVQSVAPNQLDNTYQMSIGDTSSTTYSNLQTYCNPDSSFTAVIPYLTAARIFYPCGLIALSTFNDGIELSGFERGTDQVTYNAGFFVSSTSSTFNNTNSPKLVTDDIAWSYDMSNKFKNPTSTDCKNGDGSVNLGSTGNLCPQNYYQYKYLWQTYSQFVCYPAMAGAPNTPNVTGSPSEAACIDWNTYINTLGVETFGATEWAAFTLNRGNFTGDNSGCAQCNAGFVLTSAGGILPPLPDGSAGVRDEGFVVWMRTAGLPTFRKLYGTIKAPTDGFKKGDKLTFSVIPNFLVSTIEGSKSLVVGTVSPLGGKNNVLGIAYITVGSICIFLAAVFAVKMKVAPRKLGDPQYLQWNK